MSQERNLKLTENQLELVEKFGVSMEQSGMPPAAARIAALLTISDTVELTFDEIRELLSLSKSATSNALNFLQEIGSIYYITKTGDRKRYFKANVLNWEDRVKKDLLRIKGTKDILALIVEQRNPKTEEFNQKLEEVVEFIDFWEQRSISFFKEWQSIKEKKK